MSRDDYATELNVIATAFGMVLRITEGISNETLAAFQAQVERSRDFGHFFVAPPTYQEATRKGGSIDLQLDLIDLLFRVREKLEPYRESMLARSLGVTPDAPAVVLGEPAPAVEVTLGSAKTCERCEGCGQLADTDDQEPWTDWTSLPPGAQTAIHLGLVKPIDCHECGGKGYA